MKAEQLGYRPQVILAGRRINDGMGKYVAQRTIKLLINSGVNVKGCRVGILGITFKENVADVRNSRVPDIARELNEYGVKPFLHDVWRIPPRCRPNMVLIWSGWNIFGILTA